MKTLEKIKRVISFGKSLGAWHFFYLIYIYFILPLFMKILPVIAMILRRYKYFIRKLNLKKEFQYWRFKKEEILKVGVRGFKLYLDDFGLTKEGLHRVKEALQNKTELIIGDIDQDGLIHSYYGTIDGVVTVSEEDFLKKTRFELKLVVFDNVVAVKKMFKEDRMGFLSELDALHNLNLAGVNVPAILDINFNDLSITSTFIPGQNLKEGLAQKGAKIRDRDIKKDNRLISLSGKEKYFRYVQEGRRVLLSVVDSQFIDDLFIEIKKIHGAGFELYDIKYDKIIIEEKSKKPFLVDYDSARSFIDLGEKFFSVMRDRDIEKFNLLFKTKKMTYKRAKIIIKDKKVPFWDKLYSPVYFGYGLRIGKIWDINVGFGRWNFILKRNLPPLTGKRILALGANNGFNEIQMLKNGAKEVMGVETSKDYIVQGNFIKEVFEWADNELYNFGYLPIDMVKLPQYNLGAFDLVVAFCSLYYLDDLSIFKLVRHLSTIANKIVLQCNIRQDIGRQDAHSYEKASVEYAVKILKENGFPQIKVIAPPEYSRPLVIGQNPKL